jgi:hypothetical protein
MNRPRIVLLALLAAVLFAGTGSLAGQELRTIVAGIAALQAEDAEGVRLVMGYDQAVAVTMAKSSPFIQGFEVELKLPPAFASQPGAFAYELWRRIEPDPDKNRYGYSGERIVTQALPARAGFVIQIPVRRDHAMKSGPYATVIPTLVEPEDFPFFFKLVPLSKGAAPEIEEAELQVRVRPVLTDEGGLRLVLAYPVDQAEHASVTALIDDKRVDPESMILLKAGAHRLLLNSENYRDESRSFVVEQGRVLDLEIELQDTSPILLIEAPDSAFVMVDGVRVDHAANPRMRIEPGEHSASCRIGDYSLSRKFTVARDKVYKLVLSVDLQLQEGE